MPSRASLGAASILPATSGTSERHNQLQEEHYDRDYAAYIQEVPQGITDSLQKIVEAADLKPSYKVLDCGCGAGRLIPHLLAAGVDDIVAVDLSIMMIALVKEHLTMCAAGKGTSWICHRPLGRLTQSL